MNFFDKNYTNILNNRDGINLLPSGLKGGSDGLLINSLFNQNKKISNNLIPNIYDILIVFGITNLDNIINGITTAAVEVPDKCPDENKLIELIKKRNNIASSLNVIYQSVDTLNNTFIGLGAITSTAELLVNLLYSVPLPLTFSTLGVTNLSSNSVQDLKQKISKYKNLSLGASYVLTMIAQNLKRSNLLITEIDRLIVSCSKEKNISFTKINKEINKLTNDTTLKEIKDNQITYKGFTLDILTEENSDFPRRYAVAKDRKGVIVIKGNPSFTSNVEVLIEEIKFIIDTQNLTT